MKLQNIILESDEQLMAAQIKAVLDKELKDGELNEVIDPVSILSYLLLSNTVIDILGKYAAKVLRKLNLNKAADKLVYKFLNKINYGYLKIKTFDDDVTLTVSLTLVNTELRLSDATVSYTSTVNVDVSTVLSGII